MNRKNETHILMRMIYLIAFITTLNFLSDIARTYMDFQYYKKDFNVKVELNQHKTNINTAGVKELKKLHGVGDDTAEKIIKGRPYKNIGEIYERGYIGSKTFDKIKNEITVEE